MSNIDYFWDFFVSKGITNIFGLPGGAISALLSKTPNSISWVNTGHELQDGFVASTYGYYTNNVGLLFVTTGPGIATALSSYKNAEAENYPLIIISTFNPLGLEDDFQWWNINQISNTIGNLFYIENNFQFIKGLNDAYNLAKTKNIGVVLLININILDKMIKVPTINPIMKQLEKSILTKYAKSVVNEINQRFTGKNTLIVLGKGKFIDYNIVKDFILRNNLPYVTTWKQRYVIPGAVYCGRLGTLGHHSANYAVIRASHILVIGDYSGAVKTDYYENKFTFKKLNKKSIVYSLVNRKICASAYSNKYFVVNNLDNILSKLNIIPNNEWINTLNNSNTQLLVDLPRISQLEKYIYSASQAYKNNSLTIPVTCGVGNHWYALGKYMDITEPNCFESTTNWSSIGIGLANGIGIHYATNKPVWIFEGDGGFTFSASTFLYLLANPNLPLTITITSDKTYSALTQNYLMKNYIDNSSNYVPFNEWNTLLPNSITFTNETDYYNYLNENPVSDKVRYIILLIDNSDMMGSNVFEINYSLEYINYAKKNDFTNMINQQLIY
uniref:Thiamine pyrophosphate enzyme N-terminal TPP-binding domain-containing protein n=1 Tax=viral metagenome TaxID=1070528 RepID=A0A6C0ITQ6_9ZZZZ